MPLSNPFPSPETENHLDKLGEMIQYVETIIEESISEIKGVLPNDVTISLLMHRKILQKVDAIFINIENGSEHVTQGIMRTLIENYIHLAYILKKNTQEKCKAYRLGYLKSILSITKNIDHTTESGKATLFFLGEDLSKDLSNAQTSLEIQRLRNEMNSPSLKSMHRRWKRKESDLRRRINWFELFGASSIKQVAKEVNMDVEYNLLYSTYSLETHSVNANQMIEYHEGIATLKPLRGYEDPDTLIFMAVTYLWRATDLILKSFFPTKQLSFSMFIMTQQKGTMSKLTEEQLQFFKKTDPQLFDKLVEQSEIQSN